VGQLAQRKAEVRCDHGDAPVNGLTSIVMPYWKRPDALRVNLDRLYELYDEDYPIEVVIVDDGSPQPARINGGYPWPVRVIRLADKEHALNPCTPINIGVKESDGDIILLTNPEVIHQTRLVLEMANSLGERDYPAASCWSVSGNRWYCHSTDEPLSNGRAKMPEGAGLHFCTMIRKSFFNEIGGFDEAYREGQAYDDNDFLWKLHEAGANFSIRDDLVTQHMDCPRCNWPKGGLDRNRRIFEAKWGQ
jgi:GT2 family glycosyltransferase